VSMHVHMSVCVAYVCYCVCACMRACVCTNVLMPVYTQRFACASTFESPYTSTQQNVTKVVDMRAVYVCVYLHCAHVYTC